ncbi:acetyl-CoA carboxylase biotin carboxylase subunit family protein [Nocardiopsis sp. L17-MgMaSL7]|uniref:ATP-grasp domain-containing protein n=1 Tax=Nocardiopsis sp. L17-MgMaSL7 TaxID=1938893 RepID=UPI000D714D8E|nr:ATP-grasp domain-containing protein [Nocardiopsis sp. L17-MgMaSL7]PWV55425.1 ATP-grasp domain-containing protein [Nocardiopsis sp. L17-MgMaSL7]
MKNVFVMGLDQRNRELLDRTPTGQGCRFHKLLGIEELQSGEIDVEETLRAARAVLEGFDGSVDAIIGFRDFPITLLVPVLCAERGLSAPDLESVVRCEHKYWSRRVQAGVTDAHPPFALVDLDADRPEHGLHYPLWVKPIKSASSELAFRVEDDEEFDAAVERLRRGVDRLGRPFERILSRVDLPAEVARADRHHCLAEGALHGVQVAAEGCVYQGEITVYGVLDSVDYPGSPSFLRHQYPSGLPEEVQRRVVETTERVIAAHGLDNSTFSVEFFYDPILDFLGIVEINPRHSQSHAALFEFVDGVANHERMLRLALGRDPHPPDVTGEVFPVAAEWYLRRFRDGVVARVPSPEDVIALGDSLPGVKVQVVPQEGQRLSDMLAQDSYSFELAKILTGGAGELEIRAKFERCVKALRFEFRDDGPTEGPARV